jgi:hypothetical protein
MLRLSLLVGAALTVAPAAVRADAFDHYVNTILSRAVEDNKVDKIDKLTRAQMIEHARVLPGVTGALLVVRTNEGRWAKVLLQPARQKIGDKESVPIALLERYVCYREGEERTVHTRGNNVRLFHDFRLSLDIGQVVPANVMADLRFVAEGDQERLEPVGKAELYLVTKHLAEATPKKGAKLVVGEKFEPRYFNGVYQLYDDGRRSGKLHLKLGQGNEIFGFYYSDKDGARYDVAGKTGNPAHAIEFTVTFPRTVQHYRGWLFTGDGRAIAGSSRLQDRETGFCAVRVEE